MKKILNAIALFAIVWAAASCADNLVPRTTDEAGRYITATFAASETKTTIGETDLTPKWAENDSIWVSDGENSGKVKLTSADITGDGASCSFLLPEGVTGTTIYAVYPYGAAAGTITEGKIDIVIPTTQDGTFASANICTAKTDGNSLSFKNATAVFRINGSSGITSVIITATGATLAGNASVGISGANAETTLASAASSTVKIFVDGLQNTYYIAAAPCTPSKIDFEFAKGMTAAKKSKDSDVSLAANNFYTIAVGGYTYDSTPSYVDLGVVVNDKPIFWASKNLGASNPQDYGDYYQWVLWTRYIVL